MTEEIFTSFKPLNDQILVERVAHEEITYGGLYIPDSAKELPLEGTVIAVGPGARSKNSGERIPMSVKPNDIILFGKYSGTEITINDKKFLLMKEEEILTRLKK